MLREQKLLDPPTIQASHLKQSLCGQEEKERSASSSLCCLFGWALSPSFVTKFISKQALPQLPLDLWRRAVRIRYYDTTMLNYLSSRLAMPTPQQPVPKHLSKKSRGRLNSPSDLSCTPNNNTCFRQGKLKNMLLSGWGHSLPRAVLALSLPLVCEQRPQRGKSCSKDEGRKSGRASKCTSTSSMGLLACLHTFWFHNGECFLFVRYFMAMLF